jgi:hypothetical protein
VVIRTPYEVFLRNSILSGQPDEVKEYDSGRGSFGLLQVLNCPVDNTLSERYTIDRSRVSVRRGGEGTLLRDGKMGRKGLWGRRVKIAVSPNWGSIPGPYAY